MTTRNAATNLDGRRRWLPRLSRTSGISNPGPPATAGAGAGVPRGGLAVDVVRGERSVRLILTGELDLTTAAWLGNRIRDVEEDAPETLVLDLRGLGFMDSSGLRELFAAQRRARREGRRLVLVKGSRPIDRVLEMVRADAAVEIVDDPSAIHPETDE